MLARRTAISICLAAVGCSQSHPPTDAGQGALSDGPAPVCTDPLADALANGAVLEEPTGFETEGALPFVAMDEQGNGIVTWQVQSGLTKRALARRYAAGVGWGGVELVLQDGFPTSVALRNGTALVALVGPTAVDAGPADSMAGVYAARFAGGAWSTQPVGVTATGWWQEPYTPPPVAVLGQSAALLAWIDSDSGHVAASVFDTSWQPAHLFGLITLDPTAAMLPSGTFAVAWSGNGPLTYNDFLVSAWDPTAGWLPAVTISQAASYPMLAACIGGRPHALWSGGTTLTHAEQLPSGEWSTGETVVAVDSETTLHNPHLVTDLAENALVAWMSYPRSGCNSTVTARYHVEGVGWQAATLLASSPSNGSYALADLAMAPSGEAWALLRSGPCNEYDQEIWAHHFQPTTGWDQPLQLASTGACAVRDGALAMGGGRTLAAWSQTGVGKIVVRWLE
jgi:hypothetical protein